jgi:regulator of sigma E protease
VEIVPEIPQFPSNADPVFGITVEPLGINMLVTNRVAAVHVDADLQPGDEIMSARFLLNDRQASMREFQALKKEIELDEGNEWPTVDHYAQLADPGTPVEITRHRDGQPATVTLTVNEMPGYFSETRGFIPVLAQARYQNDSMWLAFRNGFRQTVDDATRVLKFMRKLIVGELSVKQLGGPGTIAVVATSEASQGTSRLLLFLTLLSANLAIINFLPIPVLDGGHMVFLAYEGIFRRPVSERLQVGLSIAGMVFLIALMVTVIGLDIWRLT